jgi:hypothetical protein
MRLNLIVGALLRMRWHRYRIVTTPRALIRRLAPPEPTRTVHDHQPLGRSQVVVTLLSGPPLYTCLTDQHQQQEDCIWRDISAPQEKLQVISLSESRKMQKKSSVKNGNINWFQQHLKYKGAATEHPLKRPICCYQYHSRHTITKLKVLLVLSTRRLTGRDKLMFLYLLVFPINKQQCVH